MFAAFRSARRKSSHLAMALALAGGAAFGTAITAPTAMAQDYSRDFVEVYQPTAALTQGETPDFEAARAGLQAVYAAIETPDDRMAAGNLTLIVGQQLSDDGLRRSGLEMMIESGMVPAEQIGLFHYYVANFAFNAGDYAVARSEIEAAVANGYVDADSEDINDPEYIIMQSYSAEDNPLAAIEYITGVAQQRVAAGQAVPERWLLRALQDSYDYELIPQATSVSQILLQISPTDQNWLNALQVINVLNEWEPAERVDFARLMMEADVLTQRPEFIRYIEDLDPRIMGNEVLGILQAGLAAGEFEAADPYYIEVRDIATPRAAADRRQISTYISDGENGDSREAMSTGEVLFSMGDYAQAERFYQLALERGFEANTANTRIGIAQAKQGNFAAAIDSFAQVSGTRATIATMWSAYASAQMTP